MMPEQSNNMEQELFSYVVRSLSAPWVENAQTASILAETARVLSVECGFIYTALTGGALTLRESYAGYDVALPESLEPSRFPMEMFQGHDGQPRAFFLREGDARNNVALREIFDARILVLYGVYDTDASGDMRLLALLGLADRRGRITINPTQMATAETILLVLANHVRLRIKERILEQTTSALRDTLDHLGIDIYVNDYETHEMMYANESMAAPYGGWEAMKGKKCYEALYDDGRGECDFCPKYKLVDENGEPTRTYSWDYQRPFDGKWFRVLSGAFRWTDGRLAHVITSVDITENKVNEQTILRLANYDALTDLPNRRKLEADIDQRIPALAAKGQQGFILFFDLDDFKHVNDTYGHNAGDELLQMVGLYMRAREDDWGVTYRNAGDEFVMLARKDTLAQARGVAEQLVERFRQPWVLSSGHEVTCGASVGIAVFPDHGGDAELLLRHADEAMYQAKHEGKGKVIIYDGMQ